MFTFEFSLLSHSQALTTAIKDDKEKRQSLRREHVGLQSCIKCLVVSWDVWWGKNHLDLSLQLKRDWQWTIQNQSLSITTIKGCMWASFQTWLWDTLRGRLGSLGVEVTVPSDWKLIPSSSSGRLSRKGRHQVASKSLEYLESVGHVFAQELIMQDAWLTLPTCTHVV